MSFSDDIRLLLREKELSCAALGELLSVDEGVVSSWEIGSKLPDKDELCLLREHFPEAELPAEIYNLKIEEAEAKAGFKCNRRRWLKTQLVFCIIFFVIGIAFKYAGVDTAATVGFIMAFVYLAICLSPLAPLAKQNRKSLELFSRRRFEYCVFRDRVSVTTWEGEKRMSECSYFYDDATFCIRTDKLLLPYFNNSYLIIPLRGIAADSLLLSALDPKTVKQRGNEKTKASKTLRIISIVLLVMSIVALPIGALIIVGALMEAPTEIISVMILVCSVPVISMVYGLIIAFLGKREGRKNTLVAAAVILILSLTLSYGSRYILQFEVADDGPQFEVVEAKIEDALGTDIPQPDASELYYYNVAYDDFFVYYYGYLYFNQDDVSAIIEATDEFWLDYVPNSLKGICEDTDMLSAYDTYLFYNLDSGERNTLPAETGQYRFMVLYYSYEYNEVYIAEYDLDYVQ